MKQQHPRRSGRQDQRPRPVRPDDLGAILAAAAPVVRDLLEVQGATGLRAAEVCGLQGRDVAVVGDVCHVASRDGRNLSRSVRVTGAAAAVLRRRLRDMSGSGHVFTDEQGLFTVDRYVEHVAAACAAAGVDTIDPKTLRVPKFRRRGGA